MKPKETLQKPGKVARAVALGLYVVMRPIMHLQTNLRLSVDSAMTFSHAMALQHGELGEGSGEPYVMNVEQVETSAVTDEHSTAADTDVANASNINTPIIVNALWLSISLEITFHYC